MGGSEVRDEITIYPDGNASYFGAMASKVAYKCVWPTGERGTDWVQRLRTNPNYSQDEEHPFWFSEKEGMVCLTPALLTDENPEGDVTVIFSKDVSRETKKEQS